MLPDHVILKKSPRARKLALRLDPKDRLFHLVVPKHISLRKAERFAEEHESWMQERLKSLPPRVFLIDGAILPVLGHGRRICIQHEASLKRTQIDLTIDNLNVLTNQDEPQNRIKRFLKALARDELSSRSHQKAKQIGQTINAVSIRDTKSRWGSCSAEGNLSFSWRLIFAPLEAMDYVVAHEVAHLEHLDHSKAFWRTCRDLSDNYLEGEYWMREHGAELMRYG